MARTKQGTKLITWNKRKGLEVGKNYQEFVSPKLYLGYRRPLNGGAGSWFARWQKAPNEFKKENIGFADDFQDANGKTILTYAQAQTQAVKWHKLKDREALDDEPIPSGKFTVADALDAYFKDGSRRGMKGLDRARMSANARIVPALGNIEVAKLTRTKIEKWLDDLAKSPRLIRTRKGQGQAFAPPPATDDEKRARKDTANRILAILKAALNYVIDRRKAQSHDKPWRDVKPHRETTKARVRFLEPDEVVKLVNTCPSDFRDIVRGALLTGCRYSELARLQCRDYNPKGKIPTIHVAESKSGKPRHINLTPEAVDLFDELTGKRKNTDDLIFIRRIVKEQSRDAKGKFDNTSQEYKTGAWGNDHQHRPMKMACEAAGLEYISFHELRHTYASTLINNGCPLIIVASQLGHSDTRMVEKHYGHLANDAKQAALLAAMPTFGIVEPSKIQKLKLS